MEYFHPFEVSLETKYINEINTYDYTEIVNEGLESYNINKKTLTADPPDQFFPWKENFLRRLFSH